MVPGTELLYRCHPFRMWESSSVAIPNCGPNVHEMNAFVSLSCIQRCATDFPESRTDTDDFYRALTSLVRELKHEYPNYYFYIAGDFNATLGDEETLYGWANVPSRPRFGRLKWSKNGEKFLQFCKANGLCIMNQVKKGRKGAKETWAHPSTRAKSVKDYMLTFGKERAQICFVRVTGH